MNYRILKPSPNNFSYPNLNPLNYLISSPLTPKCTSQVSPSLIAIEQTWQQAQQFLNNIDQIFKMHNIQCNLNSYLQLIMKILVPSHLLSHLSTFYTSITIVQPQQRRKQHVLSPPPPPPAHQKLAHTKQQQPHKKEYINSIKQVDVEMERKVYQWARDNVHRLQQKNRGRSICRYAKSVSTNPMFQASSGWLNNFLKRHSDLTSLVRKQPKTNSQTYTKFNVQASINNPFIRQIQSHPSNQHQNNQQQAEPQQQIKNNSNNNLNIKNTYNTTNDNPIKNQQQQQQQQQQQLQQLQQQQLQQQLKQLLQQQTGNSQEINVSDRLEESDIVSSMSSMEEGYFHNYHDSDQQYQQPTHLQPSHNTNNSAYSISECSSQFSNIYEQSQ